MQNQLIDDSRATPDTAKMESYRMAHRNLMRHYQQTIPFYFVMRHIGNKFLIYISRE
jgi:hypothetical protein